MMSFFKKFVDSSKELGKVQTLAICAMMLALRVIFGVFANSLLPFLPYVKVGLTFIPLAIVALLYGPVCAAIVSGAGDILSIILNNPTGFAITPGITLCCVLEGILYGAVLYHTARKLWKVIVAQACVIALCTIALNTLALYLLYHFPFTEILFYRTVVLIPFGAVQAAVIYYLWTLIDKLKDNKHIKI